MRINKHLDPAALNLTDRQHFFLCAWYNLVHHQSLDSYRVRVMNPLNILRELRRMFEPPANEDDCRMVAEEVIEVFGNHPVLEKFSNHYPACNEAITLLAESVQDQKPGNGFKKQPRLLQSFIREFEVSLRAHFLEDCFAWVLEVLNTTPVGEAAQAREEMYSCLQRVCRDILSVAHDEGFSFESLFHLYRYMHPDEAEKVVEAQRPYSFIDRLIRVKGEILDQPKTHHVVFKIQGVSKHESQVSGTFGQLRISDQGPVLPPDTPPKLVKLFTKRQQLLFADVLVESRDGRSAGLLAYRQIGQVLDLMRFEYDHRNLKLSPDFLLEDNEKYRLLSLPQLIPNPEADLPSQRLEEFVQHLDSLSVRDGADSDSKDRIFAAFRLYRVGTDVSMFENKLVNWWTGIEYLVRGSKTGGGDIGEGVKAALAPTLGLIYLPKHLSAFRATLASMGAEIQINGADAKFKDLSNADLFAILKDPTHKPILEEICNNHPYLWHHLLSFIENVSTPSKIADMMKAHDRRVRWQIERIYRARCDIVHSGKQVVSASLLCANLEYYLRMTLKSMLQAFREVPTLRGPAEFFERRRHQYGRVTRQLEPTDRKVAGSDSLLAGTLN